MKWTPTERPFPLPDYVLDAIQRLTDAGFIAYLVGGSVRDFLLGRESKDHDLATDATPDRICDLFPSSITVGKAFGVIKVPTHDQENLPVVLEIATFRKDLDYGDHRHPDGVEFSGPEEDARRRDFTVNGLFYDPKRGAILDTVGGMADLQARLIRAIGDPEKRFAEDALRLLRAVRFATTLDFSIEPATAKAIKKHHPSLSLISMERVHEEVRIAWASPQPNKMLDGMADFGLLDTILPEVAALKGADLPLWSQLLTIFKSLRDGNPMLVWTALLYVLSPVEIRAIFTRFRFSKSEEATVLALLLDLKQIASAPRMREADLQRLVRKPSFRDTLKLSDAIAVAENVGFDSIAYCRKKWSEFQNLPLDHPSRAKWVTGQDLIAAGVKPGPGFSKILRDLEDLALEGKLQNRDQALAALSDRLRSQ
ncbi:MAG: CCA tRNA nucleotidyltransferase [Bdellovibrionota bacterium]